MVSCYSRATDPGRPAAGAQERAAGAQERVHRFTAAAAVERLEPFTRGSLPVYARVGPPVYTRVAPQIRVGHSAKF